MSYMNNVINSSPTIEENTGAKITNGAGLMVKYDGSGNIILCSAAGEPTIGVLAADTPAVVESGDRVTIVIKDICLVKAGAAFAKGAEIMVGSDGKGITATATKFVAGHAMKAAGAADVFIPVQIIKAGYKPASA